MGKLTHTVKGPIASFCSADKANIESLKLHFLPVQEGSGDASPQNIRNIFGWTGCNLNKAKKNLFDYDENNVELNLTTTSGLTRGVYHTGIISDGRYISVSASLKDPKVKTNNTFNLGYMQDDNTIYVSKSFISYSTGLASDVTYTAPVGHEFVIIDTANTLWSWNRNIPRYDLQIEIADSVSEFESYSGETIPIFWSSHGVEYGGYVDPVRGKLVAEYELLTETWGDWGTAQDQGDGTVLRVKRFTNPVYGNSINNHHTDYCNVTKYNYANENGNPHYYIVGNSYNCRVYLPTDFSTDQVIQVIGKLITPIEYDITPTELKTFLDYNNFWSDMNDDTEVEYEFVDRLSARKALFQPETKTVDWNQLVRDGNFARPELWYVNRSYGTISASNNIMTWTCTTQPTQYYHTGFMRDSTGDIAIPWDHKVIVRAVVRCSIATLFNLYALVGIGGNTHTYYYRENIPANEWTELIGFVRDRPEIPPSGVDDTHIRRFKACISGTNSTISTVTVGTTFDVKEYMAFDLTEMFGAGNEPSTVAEFKRICELNGIDLDTYQEYDTGSDRLLIMPM